MSLKPTQCYLDVMGACESVVRIDVGDDLWLVRFIDFEVPCWTSLQAPSGIGMSWPNVASLQAAFESFKRSSFSGMVIPIGSAMR